MLPHARQDKRTPLDPGKETEKKVGIEVGLAQSEFDVAELEWEVVRRAAFGVAGEEVVCDKAHHGEEREKDGVDGPGGPTD